MSAKLASARKFPTLSPRLVILLRTACVEDHLNAIAKAAPGFEADVEVIRQAVHQLRARCSASKFQP